MGPYISAETSLLFNDQDIAILCLTDTEADELNMSID